MLVLALLGVASWGLARATKPVEGPSRFSEGGSKFYIVKPHFRQIGAEGLRMSARGEDAVFNQEDNTVLANQIYAMIYRDGRKTEVWSRSGLYNLQSTTATLAGGVTLANDQGYTFAATTAVYRHDPQTLTVDGPFEAKGNGLELRGIGLRYDVPNDTFTVEKNVGANIERFRF
jgi:LPS export ABC transporter protein LptC